MSRAIQVIALDYGFTWRFGGQSCINIWIPGDDTDPRVIEIYRGDPDIGLRITYRYPDDLDPGTHVHYPDTQFQDIINWLEATHAP